MYIFAYICLLIALLAALGGGCMALLQLWQNRSDYLRLIQKGQWIVSLCMALASSLLLHALFWQDYRLEYVSSYTDSFLPAFYRLTAFWAGQPGSMLFWALATSLTGSIFALVPAYGRLENRTRLWFWSFFYINMAFFCLILTSWSNPFIMQEPVPVDGNGLNPLLQNPGMIFHPPLLFMGYAGFTVPGCLAIAQMLNPDSQEEAWFRSSRPFVMLAWILLTAGIVLGAWWAYMELGWGGYWAWDPVENASLLPWLAGTAAIHVMAMQNRTGKLARTSAALMGVTIAAAFFATYLTRSGIIQSVHAFGDGGVGTPLLVFVLASLSVSVIFPFSAKAKTEALSTPFSREGCLVLAAWIFLALAAIITIATMWPVFSGIGGAAPQGLEASFYNRVCLPLAAILLVLLAACSWLGWDSLYSGKNASGRLIITCGVFVAALAVIWFAGYRQPLALFSAAAAIAALCSILMCALERSIWKKPRKLSAAGAHLGLAILALGVAFSGPYTLEKEMLLSSGQKENVGPYTVTLENVRDGEGPGYDFLAARLKIDLGRENIGVVTPERRIYAKFGSMQFSEVDVIQSLGQDIYASLLGMDEDYRVLVKISLEPLVNWIWIGGTLMCVLPLFGIFTFALRRKTA